MFLSTMPCRWPRGSRSSPKLFTLFSQSIVFVLPSRCRNVTDGIPFAIEETCVRTRHDWVSVTLSQVYEMRIPQCVGICVCDFQRWCSFETFSLVSSTTAVASYLVFPRSSRDFGSRSRSCRWCEFDHRLWRFSCHSLVRAPFSFLSSTVWLFPRIFRSALRPVSADTNSLRNFIIPSVLPHRFLSQASYISWNQNEHAYALSRSCNPFFASSYRLFSRFAATSFVDLHPSPSSQGRFFCSAPWSYVNRFHFIYYYNRLIFFVKVFLVLSMTPSCTSVERQRVEVIEKSIIFDVEWIFFCFAPMI